MSKHIIMVFFTRRLCSNLAIFALATPLAFAAFAPSAKARPRNQLVLATSPDDAALRARLGALSPRVNPEEARRVVSIAYTTGRELAHKWQMGSSPTFHSFLINIGAKKAGYCHQFATELLLRLDAQKLQTLELRWGESDAGTDTEHNVIVVTARGQPFAQGIMLDNWRRSGRLLWGPLDGDPHRTWQENKDALASRLPRRSSTADQPKRKTNPKSKPHRRSKTPARGDRSGG
ncbi:MAG TPA: hypothetical protein VNP98_01300 [Chthoniobacterales bacterium]|nr:hypothetical protein [Chthoniobacterales bacterium]